MVFLSRWHSYPGSFDRENDRECLNWRLYAGGALIEVADLVISTVTDKINSKSENLTNVKLSFDFYRVSVSTNFQVTVFNSF